MKTFQKILTACCLALFVASVSACSGGPGEIKKVDEADRTLPPAAANSNINPDDPNSGTNASFE
ncbi:MAG: hypothetical protein VYE64_08455 [Planctomycetota bacterium]|jgi:hypothetical protein|nr:hypothetical protein [Planctomycetota bacterium]